MKYRPEENPLFPSIFSSVPAFALSPASPRGDALGLIWNSGPVVKFVLLVLVFFSVVSWAIIVQKYLLLSRAQRESDKFLQAFWGSRQLDTLYESSAGLPHSPLAKVFREGYREFSRIASRNEGGSVGVLTTELTMENVSRALHRTTSLETTRLERAMTFLATTGSASPFIGLFGTVWGIMNSFREIGQAGTAGLAVVAPGISEALIATAMGLAAAIPAVIAYNYFLSRIRLLSSEMENFSSEFLNIVERSFLQK